RWGVSAAGRRGGPNRWRMRVAASGMGEAASAERLTPGLLLLGIPGDESMAAARSGGRIDATDRRREPAPREVESDDITVSMRVPNDPPAHPMNEAQDDESP